MVDSETKTLWSHLLGEGMRGPLKGSQLEQLPGVMTDWKTWRKDHPDTTVLSMSRTAKRFLANARRNPADYVLAMAASGEPRAWPYDQLIKQPVVNDTYAEMPVLIYFNKATFSAYSFERKLDGKQLAFSAKDGKLIDKETGSVWEPTTGKAIEGELKGKQLTPALGFPSFRRSWKVFHPDSTYWQP